MDANLLSFLNADDAVVAIAVILGLVLGPFLLVFTGILGYLAVNHYMLQPWHRVRRLMPGWLRAPARGGSLRR
jgi:hypothetical protein